MADAPVNKGLKEEIEQLKAATPELELDTETGVLLVMGTIVITLRHVLEERVVTPPGQIAARMAAGLLRSLGLTRRVAARLAERSAGSILQGT